MIAPALPDISFVSHPMFSARNAEKQVEALRPGSEINPECRRNGVENATSGIVPEQLPHPLSREEERYLFCRMNFLKFRACRLRAKSSQRRGGRRVQAECDSLLREADAIRNRIIRANLRLVAALAGRFATPHVPADELFSEGSMPLVRAVELFDFSRGLCFSTYATHAVRHRFFRYLKLNVKRARFHVWTEPHALDGSPGEGTNPTVVEQTAHATKNFLSGLLQTLPERERLIVAARWGLDDHDQAHTYEQIAQTLGLSKERVRVLAHRSMARLQQHVADQRLEMPC